MIQTREAPSHTPQIAQNALPQAATVGQNGADFHLGTINVPSAIQAWACAITLGTRLTGGHHQLFSPLQSVANVSTASEPGF